MRKRKGVDVAAALRIGPGEMVEALSALRDREWMLMQAYIHFERLHGARVGQPGVCWPTDAEVAAYLRRSPETVRRSRAGLLQAAFITLRYVPPFGRLPNGTTSAHGANVIVLLEVGGPAEASARAELVDARAVVQQLELELTGAKKRVAALEETVAAIHDGVAANDDAAPTSHNAPYVITPAWSPRKALARGRAGESPATSSAVNW